MDYLDIYIFLISSGIYLVDEYTHDVVWPRHVIWPKIICKFPVEKS